jgi:AcrR family transcriptional regulator
MTDYPVACYDTTSDCDAIEGMVLAEKKRVREKANKEIEWDLEGLLAAYEEETGSALSRAQVNRYLREGLLPPASDKGIFQEPHLERLRMIDYLRSRYGMSLKDISGLFGVIEGVPVGDASGEAEVEKAEVDRRQAILGNASELFARKGYHGTTIDEIVQATGIAKGTFYIYFDSKEALLLEVVRQLVDETMKQIDLKLSNGEDRDFITSVEMKGQEFLELYLSKSEILYMLIGETVGNPRLLNQLRNVFRQLAETLEEDLRKGVEAGVVFPYPDLKTISYALVGVGQTLAIMLSMSDQAQFEKTGKTVHQFMQRAFAPEKNKR